MTRLQVQSNYLAFKQPKKTTFARAYYTETLKMVFSVNPVLIQPDVPLHLSLSSSTGSQEALVAVAAKLMGRTNVALLENLNNHQSCSSILQTRAKLESIIYWG